MTSERDTTITLTIVVSAIGNIVFPTYSRLYFKTIQSDWSAQFFFNVFELFYQAKGLSVLTFHLHTNNKIPALLPPNFPIFDQVLDP